MPTGTPFRGKQESEGNEKQGNIITTREQRSTGARGALKNIGEHRKWEVREVVKSIGK